MSPPKVFISATSGDLRSVRQIVKEALLTINCHPVEQTNFEPDWRTVEGMLRGKVSECQALIHIAGMRYGAEPDPSTLPAGTPRRSYTQMEYHLGCQLHEERGDKGFRVYTFVCPEDFPYDTPVDDHDVPLPPEDPALLQRQRDHRDMILGHSNVFETPKDDAAIHARILALQEQVLSLQHQQVEVRQEVRRSGVNILRLLGVVVLLLGGIAGVQMLMQKGIVDIKAGQTIDTARIKTHLRESSERKLAEDLATADREKKSEDRQRLMDIAQSAHQSRLGRIDELAASFAVLDGQADASPILREMTRILQEEGVDAALKYAEKQKPKILEAVAAEDAVHLEQKRGRLQPLLKAAGLQANKGQTAAARASYGEVLKLDAQWSGALEDFAWFLFDQSSQSAEHGTLTAALADAQQCLAYAQRYYDLDETQPRARRVLSAAHNQMSDVLVIRGAEGDASQIIQHCQQSLALDEALYKANSDSAQAARDVSVSLNKLADFLASRGQLGDAAQALQHYQRSLEVLEKLLLANPGSAQATRDVSVSSNKLADFLASRGQPGDAEQALLHYQRDLDISEKLLRANPDSAQAARDVSVSCAKLALLAERTGKGDAQVLWRRAYDILNGMKEKGMFVSPQDLQILEALRAKIK